MKHVKILKRGELAVSKKDLIEHCNAIQSCINDMDSAMAEKESYDRGKKISLIMNRMTFTLHSTKRFMLDIDLKKLNNFIK